MSDGHDLYRDLTFRDAGTQIRLLKVLPAKRNNPMTTELAVYDVASAPPYLAISYTWGPRNMKEILVNGIKLSITQNCKLALWQAQRWHPDIHLWIDAICIDQANNDEKAQQVQQMYDIYTRAQRVLASMGEDFRDCHWLSWIANVLSLLNGKLQLQKHFNGPIRHSLASALQVGKKLRLRLAMKELLEKEYWSRVWVMQEIAAGGTGLVVVCGKHTMSWSGLKIANSFCQKEHVWSGSNYHIMAHVSYEDRVLSMPARLLHPRELFSKPRLLRSTDPKDQIYGLFNLVDWTCLANKPPPVDYKISALELAYRFTAYLGASLNVTCLRGLLDAMSISEDSPEMQTLINVRIGMISRGTAGSFDDANKAVIYSDGTFANRVRLTPEGRLTAAFAKNGKPLLMTRGLYKEALGHLQMILSSEEPSSTNLRNRPPRAVYVGGNIVAFVCHDTQPGDILVKPGFRKGTYFLIARQGRDQALDVVGQGLILKGYCMGHNYDVPQSSAPQCPPASSVYDIKGDTLYSVKITLHLNIGDAIVLFHKTDEHRAFNSPTALSNTSDAYRLWINPVTNAAGALWIVELREPHRAPTIDSIKRSVDGLQLASLRSRFMNMTGQHDQQDVAKFESKSELIELDRAVQEGLYRSSQNDRWWDLDDLIDGCGAHEQDYRDQVEKLRRLLP